MSRRGAAPVGFPPEAEGVTGNGAGARRGSGPGQEHRAGRVLYTPMRDLREKEAAL